MGELRPRTTRLKSKVFSLEILILLIWTNVPRTNVAWTNVVVTVVIPWMILYL